MYQHADVDFETRSTTDLRTAGIRRYVEDTNTGTWGFSYNFDNGPVKDWEPGMPDPVDLLEHVRRGGRVGAHNAAFERWIWNAVLRCHYGLQHWPVMTAQQQTCTMARAAAHGLPQDLDTLCNVLVTVNRKDKMGNAVMRKMMKPRKVDHGQIIWWDEPQDVEILRNYRRQDVRTESEIHTKLPELSPHERQIWELDQKINDRGIPIDIVAVTNAVNVTRYAKKQLDLKIKALTDGFVGKVTEVSNIVTWLAKRGIRTETLRKGDYDDLLVFSDLAGDPVAREVLELRREGAKTSTSKYDKILDCVCEDGRIYNQFNYHGAGPGRWAGRLVQPQNLYRLDPDADAAAVAFTTTVLGYEMSAKDIYELIEIAGFEPLPALAKSMRGMIQAEPGKKLMGGDFANIEGRLNAWFSGETWKLLAFQEYDLGIGPDLYKVTAGQLTGKTPDLVAKIERQTMGKVPELACGYQGGVGAFKSMAHTQNPPVKPEAIVPPVKGATPEREWAEMLERFDGAPDKHGLLREEWCAIKLVVTGWRKRHPLIVQGWWDLGDAAVEAVAVPGQVVPVYGGKARYVCSDGWLYCQLPSGRLICYCNPWIETRREERVEYNGRWIDVEDFPTTEFLPYTAQQLRDAGYKVMERTKHTVHFMGMKDGQWREKALYGGLQCENIVQGAARCLLDRAMLRVEAAGYPIILHAHDEILCEVDEGYGSVQEFQQLMSVLPDFVTGLPLATAVWEDKRYVK